MALRQADRIQLDGLQDTITTLAEFDISKEAIQEKLKDKITAFENATNTQFKFTIRDKKAEFSLTDLKSDYLRTRQNPDKTMTSLRAKIFGLPFDIKIDKDGIKFSNEEIAAALGELQSLVSQSPKEFIDNPHEDWARRPGEEVFTGDDDDSDMNDEGNQKSEQPLASVAPSTSTEFPTPNSAEAVMESTPSAPLSSEVESTEIDSPEFPGDGIDSPNPLV